MKKILAEIQSGEFANEYIKEYRSGNNLTTRKEGEQHAIEEVGNKLRSMMP